MTVITYFRLAAQPIGPILRRIFLRDRSLESIISEFLEKKSKQANAGLIVGRSADTYQSRLGRFATWLKIEYPELPIREFNPEHLDEFVIYMHSTPGRYGKPCGHNYTQKHVQLVKEVFKFARAKGYIRYNHLELRKVHFKWGKAVYLELAELEQITLRRFASGRLQAVADLFVFQCFTGLSFTDVATFDPQTIRENKWIILDRNKTGQESIIPLLPTAAHILTKYDYSLPVISNAKYNSYLKEVADIAGITKHITTHTGRKTFAQMMADRGFTMDAVSKMLGHANTKTTVKTYAGISTKRILAEQQKLAA